MWNACALHRMETRKCACAFDAARMQVQHMIAGGRMSLTAAGGQISFSMARLSPLCLFASSHGCQAPWTREFINSQKEKRRVCDGCYKYLEDQKEGSKAWKAWEEQKQAQKLEQAAEQLRAQGMRAQQMQWWSSASWGATWEGQQSQHGYGEPRWNDGPSWERQS